MPYVLLNSYAAALEPDPYILLSEWAEERFVLPQESSGEYGKYRINRTPFVREPLDELSPQRPTNHVVLIKPTQLAGTTIGIIFLMATADLYPGPTLFVAINVEKAKGFSKKRIATSVAQIPSLKEKIKEARSRDSGNTILMKEFPGGSWILAGSNSGASYRGEPAKYVILDDFDGFPSDIEGEGSPLRLADRRTGSFANSKIFINSTPTVDGESLIQMAFENTSQGLFSVPCPHCKVFQYLEFGDANTKHGIKFVRDASGDVTDVWYECKNCHERIDEHQKSWMLPRGKYIHKFPDREKRGFKYNALYSPIGWKYSWKVIVNEFLEAKKDLDAGKTAAMKSFMNTLMAEPWRHRQKARTEDRILKLCDDRPRGVVPGGGVVAALTAGVDTQDDGFYYEIRAWGFGMEKESWCIREGFVIDFGSLARILWDDEYSDPDGNKYFVRVVFQDALGHRTAEVYDFCRRYQGRIFPTFGKQTMAQPHAWTSLSFYPGTKKPIPGGLRGVHINTEFYKNELSRLLEINPADPGAYHYHSEVDSAWAAMMTAEYINEKGIWECPPGKANHGWDVSVLNLAAHDVLGIRQWKKKTNAPKPTIKQRPARDPLERSGGMELPSWAMER